jgi:hypothetical protein
MRKPLLILTALLMACMVRGSVITVNFTPYNCGVPTGFDTTVNCTDGDTLIVINTSPGISAINFFVELNGSIIDTISSSPGDTLWRTVIGPADSLLSFFVWTLPGACYGQRFTLQRFTGIRDLPFVQEMIWDGRGWIIRNNVGIVLCSLYSFSGQLLERIRTCPKENFRISPPDGYHDPVLLVFESELGAAAVKRLPGY